jgi:hypothetical protein
MRRIQMKITQIIRSASDQRLISQLEIGSTGSANIIPIAGDDVSWVVEGKTYAGQVKSRLISYSTADKIGLERSDETDINVALSVEIKTN